MGAESPPMVTTGSAMVAPILVHWALSGSPSTSATMTPGMGTYHMGAFAGSSAAKPTPLPKDIFITASARPCSTAQAALTRPWRHSSWKYAQDALQALGSPEPKT